ASPARSSARQTPGATDNTSPRSPRSGGLRPPCSGPAKPEHRLAAASQRSLQACIASLPLQSSWMSKTYLKSDHFNGGGSLTGQPDQRRRRRPLYRCRHLRVLSPVRAAVFWFRRRLIAAARDAKYGTLVTATEAPILTTPIALLGGTFSALPTLLSFSFLPSRLLASA